MSGGPWRSRDATRGSPGPRSHAGTARGNNQSVGQDCSALRMNHTIHIYSQAEAHQIPWPDDRLGRMAESYLMPLLTDGVKKYIANVSADLYVILINGKILPLTLGHPAVPGNCYVVSPYTHFVSYAMQELRKLHRPFLRALLLPVLQASGPVFRFCEIDKVATINNWLFSTNLYPSLTLAEIKLLISTVQARFPDYPVYFRSINPKSPAKNYPLFEKTSLFRIISRTVYYQEPAQVSLKKYPSIKKDLKLLQTSPFKLLTDQEINERLVKGLRQVYLDLYIHKYSIYNPQYTLAFFTRALRASFFEIYAFVTEKEEVRAGGLYYRFDDELTTPILGYDLTRPQKEGLYRLATLRTFQVARPKQYVVNRSSGAPGYKRARGGQQVIEYSYVNLHKQPFKRRLPWLILHYFFNPIVKILLVKFKL